MRQILFHIPLDQPVSFGPLGKIPLFGFGLLLVLWIGLGIWTLVARLRSKDAKWSADDSWSVGRWLFVCGLILAAPQLGQWLRQNGAPPFREGLPIFGYGFMLFIAVATGGGGLPGGLSASD